MYDFDSYAQDCQKPAIGRGFRPLRRGAAIMAFGVLSSSAVFAQGSTSPRASFKAGGPSTNLASAPELTVGTELAKGRMNGVVPNRRCDFSQSPTGVDIRVPKELQGAEVVWRVTENCTAVVTGLRSYAIGERPPDTPTNGFTSKAVQR